jgi:hypothetical protein
LKNPGSVEFFTDVVELDFQSSFQLMLSFGLLQGASLDGR